MWSKTRKGDWFYHFRSDQTSNSYVCGVSVGEGIVMPDKTPSRHCPKCQQLSNAPSRDKYAPKPLATAQNPVSHSPAVAEDTATPPTGEQSVPPFLLDSVHRYTGKQIPAHMLSQEFEGAFLARALQTAQRRATECRDKLNAAKKDWQVSDAIARFVMEDARREMEGMQSMQRQAYFGRIDFAVTDNPVSESLYVGRCTLEEDGFLVYDWRNPVCEMFYQHRPGRASYQSPGGIVQGEMLLKRQFTIQGEEVVAFEDTGGAPTESTTLEDSILLGMLRRNSSGEMRDIVRSIQAEQDKVIRVRGDVVVVQGPAGSGKTVVALHRAAYLLYHKRQEQQRLAQRFGRISAQGMLVFSPNSIFSSYIARVLPDLNEEQIRQAILENTIQEEVKKCLPKAGKGERWKIERREDYFEMLLQQTEDALYRARIQGSAIKSSVVMLDAIETYLQQLDRQIEAVFDTMELSIYGQVIADPEERVFYSKSDMQDRYRLSRAASSVLESIKDVLQHINTRIVEFEKSSWISRSDGLGRNPLAITVKRLHQEKQRIESLLRPYMSYTPLELYTALLRSSAFPSGEAQRLSSEIGDYTLAFEQERKVAYEDIMPLLLLSGHYRGFPLWNDITHAVVDEAQDYSLLHYEYIKRCLPDTCTFTIVGDVNQAISPMLNLHSYDDLEAVFSKRITRLELKRSYRSSVEITDFASQILNSDLRIDNVRRTGSKPKLLVTPEGRHTASLVTLLTRLADKEYNTIAVLCKTRRDCAVLFRQLHPLMPVTLLDGSTTLEQGVLILPVQLAKGLEFDAVVLHDAGQSCYRREEERKLLYTACTRALHDLYICCSGAPSQLLPIANAALYEPYHLQN